ncbi:MAG: M15 family metallopeptidase [Oscillatoriales cyanobacterium RM1_1_9]|nr:M15 family metallopeptidase [Oscillatoriales cyanobacterium SM2_3_0]NJO71370.1 M15 family metallopeptidase [Oscillatoriales cyanobacterium RM1_1_9]
MFRTFTLSVIAFVVVIGLNLTACQPWNVQAQADDAKSNPMEQTQPLPSQLPTPQPPSTPVPQIQTYSQVPDWARLVDIQPINPNIQLDIRYGTVDNFLKKKLYPVSRCLLRREVAEKLSLVQQDVEKIGLGLKVFDCYRPWSVTKQMWEILPDPRYVANPERGSRHNRGAAVDLTLVDLKTGKELPMPTDFDDFTEEAARDYPDHDPEARRNSNLLGYHMERRGFEPLVTEWWHFDSVGWQKFSLLDVQMDKVP